MHGAAQPGQYLLLQVFQVFPVAAPRLPSLPCGFHGPHSARSRHEAGPGKFQLPPP